MMNVFHEMKVTTTRDQRKPGSDRGKGLWGAFPFLYPLYGSGGNRLKGIQKQFLPTEDRVKSQNGMGLSSWAISRDSVTPPPTPPNSPDSASISPTPPLLPDPLRETPLMAHVPQVWLLAPPTHAARGTWHALAGPYATLIFCLLTGAFPSTPHPTPPHPCPKHPKQQEPRQLPDMPSHFLDKTPCPTPARTTPPAQSRSRCTEIK